MSLNQSKPEKSDSHGWKPGRSGGSGNQRNFSGSGGGKGGGGSAPPSSSSFNPPPSTNRSFRKSGNGQGGQSRVNPANTNLDSNVPTARPTHNGAQVQPPLPDASHAPIGGVDTRPANPPSSRSTRAVPKVPSSQSTVGASESTTATPAKGDMSKAFPILQFGSISPGFMNGMQIPARTSSAPPNLDEQKRDQARHNSFRAVPTLPVPSTSKQQQPRKDAVNVNQSNTGESHPMSQAKRDVHAQVTAAPVTTSSQKPSVLPITGISMPMPFQAQVPVPFGGPNPQIQSQGITATSLQMPIPLSVGNTPQVQQQMFVPTLQSHQLQPQGMMPQGQSLSFAPQIGHQLPNIGIGIGSQFAQQQAGQFGSSRKTVKITHPETHEELRLDKRADSYLDGGSSGSRLHPNVNPQSQPIPSYTPTRQIPYYSSMQPNSFNHTSMFFQTQTTHPLTSTQMATGSQASRYNYPIGQGSISFMNPSALNTLPINKFGPPMHGVSEPTNSEHAQAVAGSASSASIQVKVKPLVGSLGDKGGSPSVTVSSPVVSKGESPKLLRPPKEARTLHPQKDSEIGPESSIQRSKSVSEPSGSMPLSLTAQQSTAASTVSGQKGPPISSTSAPFAPSEESASVVTNSEGRRKEIIRSSDSFKDPQKKLIRKDQRHPQSPHQEDASDPTGSLKSYSLKVTKEVAKHSENTQASPLEAVGSSISIPMLPSLGLEQSTTSKVVNYGSVEGEAATATSETPGGVLQPSEESLSDYYMGPDGFEVVIGGVRIVEVSTCLESKKSDLELVGTVSSSLDTAHPAKQDVYAELEDPFSQKIMETVEKEEIKLPEEPKQDSRNFEMCTGSISSESSEENKQTEQVFNVKGTAIDNVSGFVETEHKTNEEVGCGSEIDRTADSLVRSTTSSADSIDAESSPVSSTISLDNKTSIVNGLLIRNEKVDNKDVSIMEADVSDQVSDSLPTLVSSEITWKLEGKGTETTSGVSVSTSVPVSKDKPVLESNRLKNAKKKRKDILKAADAAGSTSDLYMAYKGPEEKLETAISSESVDCSFSGDVKQAPANEAEKDVAASVEDVLSKAEPDDWEDVADISTPKLTTLDNGKQVLGGLIHPDEDGSENTGRKKYSRDFLLTFLEQCTDLPEGIEIGSDIKDALMSSSHLVDRDSGRIMDKSSGVARPDRRGGGMVDDDKWNKITGPFASGRDPRLEVGPRGAVGGFRPGQGASHGVLRIPRGQIVDGILSGPMQSLVSQGGMQRNSPDADRWQRAIGVQKGLIPSPQTPLQVMHKAEKKYEVGRVSDEEEGKQRQLKAILNKLTPQNFEKLFEQVKDVNIDNADTLTGVISQIFDKALTEPTFCEMYADFCYHLSYKLPDFVKNNEKITFKRVLLNKCQEEFERGEREQAEADRVEEEGEIKCSEEEREEKKTKARRRMLGNIRLIGELYKKKMLTERIMHECIKKLLGQYQNPDEEDIEALCKLMSTIGEMIDHSKAKEHMDAYFDMMTKLSNNMILSSRVRFMLRDAIDLRKNKWQQRRKVEGPKKIEEVHRDAAQERQAQSSRLARGSSISSSARRGQPVDFGPRGSTMFSSNAQLGGLRGLPSQVRGYAQDVRLDDRHTNESRTLPVTLSQRPMDDDSITLGPQGGLARGMSIRGQPMMSGVPIVDMSLSSGDSRRAGANGYNSASDWTPRYIPDRVMGMPAYDQLNSNERPTHFGNRDLRSADRLFDRSMATSSATLAHGSSTAALADAASEKALPEEHLRDMSIAAIREFYSAKDKKEVALCMKDLNSPSFYPSMISIWVIDSFERKDMERDLLAKLLVDLTKSQDSLLSKVQLIEGFESILATLEDAMNDAPKAAEFLGRIFAKVIIENVVPLREIGRLIHEGGEERGRLRQIGLASEVLGSILEIIQLEKGESVLKEIHASSNLRLEDFRPPDPMKSRKLEAFM